MEEQVIQILYSKARRRLSAMSKSMLIVAMLTPALPVEAATVTTIHTFGNELDGSTPVGGLTQANGMLFGLARSGGAFGQGAIFKVDPTTNQVTIVYNFTGGADGGAPTGGLVNVSGTLYGTTDGGGTGRWGTIFKYKISNRKLEAIYSWNFRNEPSGLTHDGQYLYGVTRYGGDFGLGILYKVSLETGTVSALYSLSWDTTGSVPASPPVIVGSSAYGTASGGGTDSNGTIYKINLLTGKGLYIHSFERNNGSFGGVIKVGSVLYGTTARGGPGLSGTIFTLDTKTELYSDIYAFDPGPKGVPVSGLSYYGGRLYGTTCGNTGVVYEYKLLKSVISNMLPIGDGSIAYCSSAPPAIVRNKLYGTTESGFRPDGSGVAVSVGTVFAVGR